MTRKAAASRIALGTVQFGLLYGIANKTGQVSAREAAAILSHAREAGVDTLDTAIKYGESERRLGEIGVEGWRVVSKLPAVPADCDDPGAWVRESVEGSLARLKVARLHGLLLHRPDDLLGPRGAALGAAVISVRDHGLVSKLGVSVYDPRELDALCGRFPLEIVQAPYNIIDRRLADSGWLARLRQSGAEIHVRSIFLQGLLLMREDQRPASFRRWEPIWHQWRRWLDAEGLSPVQACLGFALTRPEIDRVVVGVDGLGHLTEILGAMTRRPIAPPAALSSDDAALINPSQWTALSAPR